MNETELLFGSYKHWKVNEDTHFITTLNGTLYLYLLEGVKKALLIDTAYGYGRLQALVETLTNKPVIVANTHGHRDHSGGNGWWPEVFMHENAAMDMPKPEETDPERNVFPYPEYQKTIVREGHAFDLGNKVVEVIDITAHSNGSLAFLDRKSRMLFSGDELESEQVLMFNIREGKGDLKGRVSRHLSNMDKLKDREQDFDVICPGHNGAPIAKSYLDDFVGLDRAILENRHTVAPPSSISTLNNCLSLTH